MSKQSFIPLDIAAYAIFGTWPPEEIEDKAVPIIGKIPRWFLLTAIGTIGLALIVGGFNFALWPDTLRDLMRGAGVAGVTASILGLTIDRWFKTDITQDVFKAAIGHMLPEEFRPEIQRLISHNFICIKHIMKLEIEEIDENCVRIVTTLERTVKNISSRNALMQASVAIDEWGFDQEKSNVIECKMILEDGHIENCEELEGGAENTIISASTNERKITPETTATLKMKWKEIKRHNDELFFLFSTPTRNPEINVVAQQHDCKLAFGPADAEVEEALESSRHTLKGTYFPTQRMRVRWRPKKQYNGTR